MSNGSRYAFPRRALLAGSPPAFGGSRRARARSLAYAFSLSHGGRSREFFSWHKGSCPACVLIKGTTVRAINERTFRRCDTRVATSGHRLSAAPRRDVDATPEDLRGRPTTPPRYSSPLEIRCNFLRTPHPGNHVRRGRSFDVLRASGKEGARWCYPCPRVARANVFTARVIRALRIHAMAITTHQHRSRCAFRFFVAAHDPSSVAGKRSRRREVPRNDQELKRDSRDPQINPRLWEREAAAGFLYLELSTVIKT